MPLDVSDPAAVNAAAQTLLTRRRGFVPYGPSRTGVESLGIIMTEDLAALRHRGEHAPTGTSGVFSAGQAAAN